jgi:hypothetical protein
MRSRFLPLLVGAVIIAPAVAHATPLPADASRLDLQHDTWVNVGLEGYFADGANAGRLTLGGRLDLLSWLALRADGGLQLDHHEDGYFGGGQQDFFTSVPLHVGPEVTFGWLLADGLHLRLGGSLELGAPPQILAGDTDDDFGTRVTLDDSWTARGRAGVRLEGASSFVQLEGLRFVSLDDDDPHGSALLASGFYQVDARQAFAADAAWDLDTTVSFGATYWFTFARPTLGPRTWVSVRIGGSSNDDAGGFDVGVNLLRQW